MPTLETAAERPSPGVESSKSCSSGYFSVSCRSVVTAVACKRVVRRVHDQCVRDTTYLDLIGVCPQHAAVLIVGPGIIAEETDVFPIIS